MMDADLSKWFATLGVGGALASMMFFFYRKDVRQYTELWKAQTEMLMQVVKDNTTAITRNTMVVETLHKRLDGELKHFRDEDRNSDDQAH
jgi:hypothetical protein